jgi:hypothetical protein
VTPSDGASPPRIEIGILQQRLAGLCQLVPQLAALTASHWVRESHVTAKKRTLSEWVAALSRMGDRPRFPSGSLG